MEVIHYTAVDPKCLLVFAWCLVVLAGVVLMAIGLLFCYPDKVD